MLSNNLKRIRKSKGLSQEELAIKLNVVRQTVSKWENGLSVPDSDMLITLADELDTSALTEDQKTMFDKAENFCKGEYEGDTTALTTAMEDETATASVTLDAENGATLAKNVEKAYLKILTEGTASYQADGTEIYMSTELNMVDKSMKEIFGLSADAQASPELGELSDDDRQTLYNETMKFFEKLYGESTETYDTTDADSPETAGGEENAE